MASRLKNNCSTIATVAIHNTLGPCLITVAGPTSPSPPPIDAASIIAPGPITWNEFLNENGNGSGNSACCHGGNVPDRNRLSASDEFESVMLGVPSRGVFYGGPGL